MSPLNTDDLHRIFEKLDRNGDGLVSLDELQWLLERIGVHTGLDELREDREGDNDDLESDLAKAFKVYDLNGDGYISCEELQSVLSRLGLWNAHCGKDCRRMINVYDTNSDGLLDFEEFKNMMLVSNP
ncbi:putative calcium-binding protein CML44 [Camellia lanceoleosa]|uniref:Calcium-binding protein CML44 n=1 Tax=Camellia lanceoleosa TaxID=1840588 RepID=A0ACC0GQ47_9ERIC|nr:putative calcium-binding protein CML44 [Camellia lanceoleosa]